ncbi:MAG: acyl-CoA dehydrogenase family protein [Sedimentitalea sp.]|uniref:acyl-CoA dehydrogenase family protein n=1 Tax=Sedimentitalea sp. TaxID=2048915 RepID=UPI003263F177
MIQFELPDEEALLLKETAERFVTEKYTLPQREKILEGPIDAKPACWAEMAELGWLAAPLPENVGGLGLKVGQITPFLGKLGAGMILEPVVEVTMHCAPTIARALAADRAVGALEAILSGDRLEVTVTGSPISATLSGDSFVLDGCAELVLGGAFADAFWVVARSGSDSLLVRVTRDQVQIEPFRLLDGQAAGRITFDDVTCAKSEVILACADAVAYGDDMSMVGQIAEMTGLIEALYRDTLDYVKLREQFGRPIGRFQAVQHRMADIFIKHEEAQSMVQLAAAAMDAMDGAYRRHLVLAARIKVAENARAVLRDAVQLHGGMGVTDELRVGQRVKRLLVLTQIGGNRSDHLKRFRSAA